MPYDFRPNIQINPQDFKRQEDPFGAILPSFLQGQTAANALLKRRMMMSGFEQMGQQPFMQGDPIAQAMMPIMKSDPEAGMQILPTIIAGAYKRMARAQKPGVATDKVYLDRNTGRYSWNPTPGSTEQVFPQYQAAQLMKSQNSQDALAGRFSQVMGLNVGKAVNKIDADEGKMIDQADQMDALLNDLQMRHAKLYNEYGGAIKGPIASKISDLTGGASLKFPNFNPFGKKFGSTEGISSPDVLAFNNQIDAMIGQFKSFSGETGNRLSDQDIKRLDNLKSSLQKKPEAVAGVYDGLRSFNNAIRMNDIKRANKALQSLGLKARYKPNKDAANTLMQRQIAASMLANNIPSMESLNPGDLGGIPTDQLRAMMQGGGDDDE